jgi:N-acetylglucosaminyldiphosphoundecaprenol N-acetyl-beta-D-mannosaminyltransferase
MHKYFLGVRVDNLTKYMARAKIVNFLQKDGQSVIFTPNPEMLVKAYEDKNFKEILNSSDLNLCDGKGISIMTFGALQSIPGADFMFDICCIAKDKKKGVFLLGSGDADSVKKACINLNKKITNLIISGFHEGPVISEEKDGSIEVEKEVNKLILERIRRSGAEVLFVAFGQGKQEKWIKKYLRELPNIKVIMGVGGAFDFISGKTQRAPQFMRSVGLEWLWRLVKEPKRLKRIYTAVFIFPYLYITQYNDKEFYDKN